MIQQSTGCLKKMLPVVSRSSSIKNPTTGAPCEVSKVLKYSFAIIQRLRLIFDVEQQDLSVSVVQQR